MKHNRQQPSAREGERTRAKEFIISNLPKDVTDVDIILELLEFQWWIVNNSSCLLKIEIKICMRTAFPKYSSQP
jgi:hypothetical protein